MRLVASLPTVFVAVIGLFGVAARGGGGNSCGASKAEARRNVRFRYSPTSSSMDASSISSWSDGGGPRAKLPTSDPDIMSTFAGREYAGGGRWNILGTRAYGSGYPYGVSDQATLKGRPFPHVMWPISWGPGYMGGDEYWGPDLEVMRPGGVLGILNVSTKDTGKWPGVGPDEVYTMIGDKESLMFMISDLVRVCHAIPALPRKFDPTTTTATAINSTHPRPENVIQYYRSSSFALTYANYNNTFALPSSNPTSNHGSVALPGNIVNSRFLYCVNDTIRASLPLHDAFAWPKKKLSKGAIAGAVVGSVVGAIALCWCCIWLNNDKRAPTPAPPPATESGEPTAAARVKNEYDANGKGHETKPGEEDKDKV